MKKSVLVVFNDSLPNRKQVWWRQFDTVIAQKKLEAKILQFRLSYIDLNSLVDPGNMREASEFARKLSLLTVSDGRRVSKLVNYHGYELWWIHYDDLMYRFCMPYVQYHKLLEFLKVFPKVCLYQSPQDSLFSYFLHAHGRDYVILDDGSSGRSYLGMILQVIISIPFILLLCIVRPKLMIWTSDFFDLSHDYDFRMKFIYEELRKKNIKFVEFIRSLEPISTILAHALKRRRPVIYSYAIVTMIRYLAYLLGGNKSYGLDNLSPVTETDSEQKFQFMIAMHYLSNVRGELWSILLLKFLLKIIGVRVAVIPAAINRNFCEVLACKLLGIKTIGIQHGLSPQHNFISDFMPEFDGEKHLSVDKYGLWSKWWRQYYLKNSKAYKSDQLFVSGPMRPLQEQAFPDVSSDVGVAIKVLFVSEQLCVPTESLPFLLALMETKDISLYIKFRSYRDGFEEWLKENRPEILEKIGKGKILRGAMHKAISQCDVVVGSHSTGVMEALLQLKPPIFFLTKKWGDYFDLSDCDPEYKFFARNPRELVDCVRKSEEIPRDTLKKLQERFFGDPYQNGSKWVVEQVEDILRNTRQ